MSKTFISDIRNALDNDNAKQNQPYYGVVKGVITDGDGKVTGYNVSLGGDDDIVEARKFAGAKEGDIVLVTMLNNGSLVVTGTRDGDTDVKDVAYDLTTNYDTSEEVNRKISEIEVGESIVQYAIHYSNITAPTTGWSETFVPPTSSKPYCWIRTVDGSGQVIKSAELATVTNNPFIFMSKVSSGSYTTIDGGSINISDAIYTGYHSSIDSSNAGAYLGSNGISYVESGYRVKIADSLTGSFGISIGEREGSYWNEMFSVDYSGQVNCTGLVADGSISTNNGTVYTGTVKASYYDGAYGNTIIDASYSDGAYIYATNVEATGKIEALNVYTSSQFRWLTSKPATGSAASGDQLYCVQSGGSGTGAYYIGFRSSSKYLKHDIKDVEDFDCTGLYDLPVRQYVWNEDETETPEIGFIADEVAEYFPVAAVYRDSYRDGKDPASWSDIAILPAMLKLIQDQHKEIELLKERLDNGL